MGVLPKFHISTALSDTNDLNGRKAATASTITVSPVVTCSGSHLPPGMNPNLALRSLLSRCKIVIRATNSSATRMNAKNRVP